MKEEIRFEIDGVDYYIAPANPKIITEAQKVYNKAFRKAIESGALMKRRLDDYMREQGLWDDDKEAQYLNLIKEIADLEFKLNKGGIKVSEAKEIALNLRTKRNELRELIDSRTSLSSLTAEGQADNERFDYLVSASVYDFNTRKPVFSSMDDYITRKAEDRSFKLANKYASHLYEIDDDYENTLTEIKFLKRFKFVDDKGRLINKEGKLVDDEGNLVDEDGYRIDAEGNRIDINNNPIIESNVDTAEFIDDSE